MLMLTVTHLQAEQRGVGLRTYANQTACRRPPSPVLYIARPLDEYDVRPTYDTDICHRQRRRRSAN